MYEVSIFQITRFLNPRIFHLRFVKFPNPLDSLPSSTLLFNVTIEAFSRTRVKRTNRGGRSAIWIGIEKTGGNEGSARRWKLHSMHRREGVLYAVRPAPVVDETRTVIRRRFHPSPLAFSRFPLAPRPLLLLISSDPTLYLGFPFFFFYFPFFRSGSSVFTFHGKVGLYFFEDEVFWRIIKVY